METSRKSDSLKTPFRLTHAAAVRRNNTATTNPVRSPCASTA